MMDQRFKEIFTQMVDLAASGPHRSIDTILLSTDDEKISVACKDHSGEEFSLSVTCEEEV